MDLSHRSDRELLSELGTLVGSERALTAKLVAHLGEIEDRRLHLKAGFSSMFEFCIKELRLSEGEAFRRILAARLGRRFPVVYSLLSSGSVNLSALELVRDHLTDQNHAELLEAVSRRSKREIQALLAARFPRPDAPSRIRELPELRPLVVTAEASAVSASELPLVATPKMPQRARARIEPLSEARFKVEFTATSTLREKLELCRDLMSHANPSRELGVVLESAVDLLLAELQRKRLARTKRVPRESNAFRAKVGRVTNATRREVFERDGVSCTYVSSDGRRCEARAFLELDHAEPRALGGANDADNLRVRCRAHNQLWAEEAFGRERVEHLRQQKCKRKNVEERHERRGIPTAQAVPTGTLEKVRLALKGMGFRDAEAWRAIGEVERKHAGTESFTLEQALREALAVATAKPAA